MSDPEYTATIHFRFSDEPNPENLKTAAVIFDAGPWQYGDEERSQAVAFIALGLEAGAVAALAGPREPTEPGLLSVCWTIARDEEANPNLRGEALKILADRLPR